MAIWKKTKLWEKVKDTLAIGGLLAQGGFEIANASETLRLWILAGNIGAYLVGMWMSDKDGDGMVDLFQDETKQQ